jgi:hypothetical protein
MNASIILISFHFRLSEKQDPGKGVRPMAKPVRQRRLKPVSPDLPSSRGRFAGKITMRHT